MFGTIRKHQTWLWVVIIAVMIVSLVVFFSPTQQSGGRSDTRSLGSIDNDPITADEYSRAYRETLLVYFFASGGKWPDREAERMGFNVERETYLRLFWIKKLQDHNIHVAPEAVSEFGAEILKQSGLSVERFRQMIAPNADLNDYGRFVRNNLAIEQLRALIGVPGDLVTPQVAEALYVREHQELDTQAAVFSGSDYLAQVAAPTDQQLGEFYTNRMALYRLPQRVQVSYVAFPISNYLAQAQQQLTNLSEQVDFHLRQLGTNYTVLAPTREEAEEKIRQTLIERQALNSARRDADAFATELFDKEPIRAENLKQLAAAKGLTASVTAPFDETSGLSEFDGGPNFALRAFALTPEEPFSEPLVGENAVYVIGLEKTIPSEVPPLSEIREQVAEDYKQFRAAELARQAGTQFRQALTEGLAQGKSFAQVCADQNVNPLNVPPISFATRELPELEQHVSLQHYKQLAFTTPPGQVSDFSPTREGGVIVHVQRELPIDPAKMALQMPEFLEQLRQARRQQAVNAWFQKEATKSLRNTPLMQQPPPSLLPGQQSS
jgi:peptidyl-prolyl cis-trans isomerase D